MGKKEILHEYTTFCLGLMYEGSELKMRIWAYKS